MTSSLAIRIGLAGAVACSATMLAGSLPGVAPAAWTTPQWQRFAGAKIDLGRPTLAFGWEANRIWVVAPHRSRPFLWSARVSGRALRGFVGTRVPVDAVRTFPIVDGALVFEDAQTTSTYSTAPLLSSGRLGTAQGVADDLLARTREQAPKVGHVVVEDGVRVGDRTVWALRGGDEDNKEYQLVCCSKSGAASAVVTRKLAMSFFLQLGLDARGRLWLAWLDTDGYKGALRGVPHLLELDPKTLATRSPTLVPHGLVADSIELTCAASCRLVAGNAAGDIVSWGPGERSPTRIAGHYTWPKGAVQPYSAPATLLAASYRSGRLAVAYRQRSRGSTGADEIQVVSGDARGARSRPVGAAIAIPSGWPPGARDSQVADLWPVRALFVPQGLVAIGIFQYTRTEGPSPVIGLLVPLGR